MKILLVSGNSLDVGGVETYLVQLLRMGPSMGIEALLAGPLSTGILARLQADSEVGNANLIQWRTGFPADLPSASRLEDIVKENQIVLIHAQDLRSGLTGGIAARSTKVPLLRTIHVPGYEQRLGTGLRGRLRRGYYLALEIMANRILATETVFVSGRALRKAKRLAVIGPRRGVLVTNGIDAGLVPPKGARRIARMEFHVPETTTVVCFIGRLVEQKGADVLLEALFRVPIAKPDVEVWIVGDGPSRAVLEKLAAKYEGPWRIRFLGMRHDVRSILSAVDLYVLPSRHEGMSIGLLEAMAAGICCLVTDVGENGDIVRRVGCGWVVPREDSGALADALLRLVEDQRTRSLMAEAGYRAKDEFSGQQMVEQTVAVYRRIVSRPKEGV